MRYLMVGVLLVAMAGCKIDPQLQEEIATLTKVVATAVAQIADAEGRIAVVYQDYKAGKLTKEQMDAEYQKLRMDLEVLRAKYAEGTASLSAAKDRARDEGMGSWDVIINTLLAVGGVMAGRRLGIPGLASKSAKQ